MPHTSLEPVSAAAIAAVEFGERPAAAGIAALSPSGSWPAIFHPARDVHPYQVTEATSRFGVTPTFGS